MAVVNGELLPATPVKTTLTGMLLPAATSVPPDVTVNCAVYVVLLDFTRVPRAKPPMEDVPKVNASVLLLTVIVAVTTSPIFIETFGTVTAVTTGAVAVLNVTLVFVTVDAVLPAASVPLKAIE